MGDPSREPAGSLFRQEAIDHHRTGARAEGDVLRLSPAWTSRVHRLLIGFFVIGLAYLCLGRINEYAEGPALVRASTKTDVTCPVSAVVREVLVVSGDTVVSGQVIACLEDEEQRASVQRFEQELQQHLANSLSNPHDLSARNAVAAVRSQLAFARQRLDSRRLKAPREGVVGDVRVRPGQSVSPGRLVATILGKEDPLSLIMVLPGHFRPQLTEGMPGRLEMGGYAHAYVPVTVTAIADEIIGPAEARRYLGQDVGDAVSMSGQVVLAEADLDRHEFTADGYAYPLVDGQHGTIQIKVRSVPIILTLIPGLRYLYEGRHHGFAG